jgi:hypothetical protein
MSLVRNRQSDVKRHISSLQRKHIHIEQGHPITGSDANVASGDDHVNTESDAAVLARRFAEDILPAIVSAHADGQGPSAVLPKPRS